MPAIIILRYYKNTGLLSIYNNIVMPVAQFLAVLFAGFFFYQIATL
jgi:hypothetical protein